MSYWVDGNQSHLKKFLVIAAGSIGVIVAIPAALFFVWWFWNHFVESPRFAATYFNGVLEIESVAESRRWHWGSHPRGEYAFGCTYAIANIRKNLSRDPPESWAAEWIETPVEIPNGHRNIFEECAYLWPDDITARLRKAHNNPGSFYSSDLEVLLLYAPKEGVAARIRFGD